LERSRASVATSRLSSGETVEPSTVTSNIGDDQEYGEDDYGGDNDDYGFDQFILNDGDRFSSLSFHSETQFTDDSQGCKATTELLNSLCSEMTQNDYQFFSQETLSKLGNSWAGAAHWKKVAKLNKGDKRNNGSESNEGSTQEKKKAAKKIKFIDFNSDVSGFSSLIEKHKVTSKRGADATLLSKAVTKKYEKEDHILPLDAGMGIDQLSKLFLRPNAIIRTTQKSVAFQDHVHTWDDGSFGEDNDNDDGPGYDLRDEEEDDAFFVAKLDDFRKVEKIQVGYATVAKKVDVKRLKGDLWEELQRKIPEVTDEEIETIDNDGTDPISFQKTIQEMEQQGQTQSDVTLPFYFICLLHLANEKGLALNSQGLNDIFIVQDSITLC
jgi:condensin complex subunit 2